MQNFTLKLASAAASAVVVALMTAGSAQAAYEDPSIDISIGGSAAGSGGGTTVTEGGPVKVDATAEVDCAWTAAFNGSTKSADGKEIHVSFVAPSVTKDTVFPLTVSCRYDDTKPVVNKQLAPSTNAVTQVAIQTATRTVNITVRAKGSDGSGGSGDSGSGAGSSDDTDASGALPNTGGSNVEYIWAGGALVLVGAGVTIAARRRGAKAAS